jgi:hypothetical protein
VPADGTLAARLPRKDFGASGFKSGYSQTRRYRGPGKVGASQGFMPDEIGKIGGGNFCCVFAGHA